MKTVDFRPALAAALAAAFLFAAGLAFAAPQASPKPAASAAPAKTGAIVLDDSSFAAAAKGKLLVVDFWAEWCGPCKRFEPVFLKVAGKLSDKVGFARVNVDENPKLSSDYQIQFIPYIVAIKDGKVIGQYQGSRTEADFGDWCLKMAAGK